MFLHKFTFIDGKMSHFLDCAKRSKKQFIIFRANFLIDFLKYFDIHCEMVFKKPNIMKKIFFKIKI